MIVIISVAADAGHTWELLVAPHVWCICLVRGCECACVRSSVSVASETSHVGTHWPASEHWVKIWAMYMGSNYSRCVGGCNGVYLVLKETINKLSCVLGDNMGHCLRDHSLANSLFEIFWRQLNLLAI